MTSETLAAALAWLEQRIEDDPHLDAELFARLTAEQHALGLLHDERAVCPFVRPLVVARAQYERVSRAAQVLAGAFERLTIAALADASLLAELDLTEREARMSRIDPGYNFACVTSRLDAYLNGDDFQFLEYNAENPAGIADQSQLERVLFALPHMREFLARYPHWLPRPHARLLATLIEVYREWGGEVERPQVAIVDWAGVSTESEFRILQDYFKAQGHPTEIADPRSLTFDGEHLRAGDFRIDILYKRVVIHEFLERFDETHPLSRAYAEHKVCMVNPFRAKLAHKKLGFAVLSSPAYAHLFTDAELAAIAAHIPWTRRVRPGLTTFDGGEDELLDILRRERARRVLKPNDDYGGAGVVIGWETSAEDWELATQHALSASYVVQERAAVRKVRMHVFLEGRLEREEMFVDFNPYLFRGRAEGALVRLSSSSLCNVSSGGGETALLVLED
ncbi:MAG TPA: hypothetical protein VER76_01230 [Pyrinomonadaceae bacterium]|nr:hypothetical protein [Pyrinomonadaceae bacterium]